MKPSVNTVPVFALDDSTTWLDLENAMEASVEYQSSKRGKILPLMFFAPLTEPANPDAWLPLKTLPEHLLIVSIERHIDTKVLKALKQAQASLGDLIRLNLRTESGDWLLWLDNTYKLVRIVVAGENTEVVRD